MFLEKYAKARLQKQAAAADVLNSIKTWMRSPAGRDMLKRLAIGGATTLAGYGATSLVDPEGKHKGKRAAASILMGLLAGYKGPEAYEWGKRAFNRGPREAWRQFKMVGLEGGTPEDADYIDARRTAAEKEIAAREAEYAKQVEIDKARAEQDERAKQTANSEARTKIAEARRLAETASPVSKVWLAGKGAGQKAYRARHQELRDIAYGMARSGLPFPEQYSFVPGIKESYEDGVSDNTHAAMATGEARELDRFDKEYAERR